MARGPARNAGRGMSRRAPAAVRAEPAAAVRPGECLAAALAYHERGYAVIEIIPGTKQPGGRGWEKRRYTADDIQRVWADGKAGIGILLGAPSGGLVDIDCDAPEARAAAPYFLPPTGRRHGRQSAPGSHYWYVVAGDTSVTRYRDP